MRRPRRTEPARFSRRSRQGCEVGGLDMARTVSAGPRGLQRAAMRGARAPTDCNPGRQPVRGRERAGYSVADRLDLDDHLDPVRDEGERERHAQVAAAQLAHEVAPADLALALIVLAAGESPGGELEQCDRAAQAYFAACALELIALELHVARDEPRHRGRVRIEALGSAQDLVELRHGGADAVG